jgi:hypothetical protein
MTSDYLKGSRSLEEVYALIDKNRVAAARAAEAKFHNDMEAAIATIASIGSIASARVLADSRVASAKVLINAELAASRLLAEAEMQASKCVNEILTKPKEVVEAALKEIGRNTTLRLIDSAKESVEKIQRDAEDAIKLLQETSAIAIREIQTLASDVTVQTKRDAELAAQKLKEYRKRARTSDEAASEGEDVADIVIKGAAEASLRLQEAIKKTLAEINRITDEACSVLHEASLAAEKKVAQGCEQALARLAQTLEAHL